MEKMNANGLSKGRIKSLNHALGVLNVAADESAEEIRKIVNTDYNKLKRVLSDVKPDVKNAFGEMKEVASDSMLHAKEKVVATTVEAAHKVDESVHNSPWIYLGGAAVASAVTGFILGRKSKG